MTLGPTVPFTLLYSPPSRKLLQLSLVSPSFFFLVFPVRTGSRHSLACTCVPKRRTGRN